VEHRPRQAKSRRLMMNAGFERRRCW